MLVTLLGSYAPGHALGHGGAEYVFSRIDQRAKAALTVLYFRRARETVYAIKGEVDDEEYDRQLKAVLDEYRKGRYAFPGAEAMAYFMGPGLAELVAHLTGSGEAQAQALLEARPVEVLHLCLCLVYESMGPEDKKKLLAQEKTPAMRELIGLISRTPSANGSNSPSPTGPPTSPSAASAPPTSPG